MNNYICNWIDIIENMKNDNTYKLAWGKAIIEITSELKTVDYLNTITFDEIAVKMIKYYWDQTFFYKLKQSANINKQPIFVQQTEILISRYKELSKTINPIRFSKARTILEKDMKLYTNVIHTCSDTLTKNVSWRFMNINNKTLSIYILNNDSKTISFSKEQVILLKKYKIVLSSLLNYKWLQLLDKYNNISNSTKEDKKIINEDKKAELIKYKNIILNKYDNNVLFSLEQVNPINYVSSYNDIIPWSFMCQD